MRAKKILLIFASLFFFLLLKNVSAVDISSCGNLNTPGTYYLTANIDGSTATTCILINASDITLDCQNFRIDGVDNSGSTGIAVAYGVDTINIRNCIVTDWEKGIDVRPSTIDITIYNTKTNSNYYGIYGNQVWDLVIDTCEVNNNNNGIWVMSSRTLTITKSLVQYNDIGLFAGDISYSFIVYNSSIKNNIAYGINLADAVSWVGEPRIYENEIVSNGIGIYFNNVSDIKIYRNRIEQSSSYGIRLYQNAQNNLIYNNLFRNNNNAKIDYPLPNTWNVAKQLGQRIYSPGNYIGGNYWTNPSGTGYSDTCTDADTDGFCDSPYTIASNNVDNLPMSWIPYLTLSVRATQEVCNRDADGCLMDVPNAVIEVWQGSNLIASGTPNVSVPDCYTCGSLSKSCNWISFLLPSGSYTLKAYASGFRNYTFNINLDSSMSYTFWMNKIGYYNLHVMLNDSLTGEPINTAKRCLYYSTGGVVPDGYPGAYWCSVITTVGGIYPFYCVPSGNYLYTFEATGYTKYTSSAFTLNYDKWDEVSMVKTTNFTVTISSDKISGMPGETFTINFNIIGGISPFTPTIHIQSLSGKITTLEFSPEYNYSFKKTIQINDAGINDVWATVQDATHAFALSNKVSINIISTPIPPNITLPLPQVNVTEWEEMGFGWALPIITPFFFYTVIAILFSLFGALITRNSSLGLGILILFIGIYSYMNIYPIWLGIILIIISAFLIVYMMRNIFAG